MAGAALRGLLGNPSRLFGVSPAQPVLLETVSMGPYEAALGSMVRVAKYGPNLSAADARWGDDWGTPSTAGSMSTRWSPYRFPRGDAGGVGSVRVSGLPSG